MKYNLKEYINKQINSLKILKIIKKNKNNYFKCLCNCGKIKDIDVYSLLSERNKTCGCRLTFHKELQDKLEIKLKSKKRDFLKVEGIAGRDKFKRRIWKCRCDCGNTINLLTNQILLKTKKFRTCGHHCIISKEIRSRDTLYFNYKNAAKFRKLIFKLSKKKFYKLTKSNCFYCNCPHLKLKK